MHAFFKFVGDINAILILFTGLSISALLIKYINWKKDNIKKTNEKLKLLEEAQLAVLHNKIYTNCIRYIERGSVSLEELDDLNYLVKPYKKLGGNGIAERLYGEVQGLKKSSNVL